MTLGKTSDSWERSPRGVMRAGNPLHNVPSIEDWEKIQPK